MLACVIAAEWIVKDNSQFYKNHHNFTKKHFITISHIKKLKNVVRYVQHVFREHQAIHETCDFFESLFSLVKLFVRYTLFSRASVYCTKLFLTLSEVWCLLVLCLRSCAASKSVLRYTHTRIPFDQVQYLAHALARRGNTFHSTKYSTSPTRSRGEVTRIPFDQVQYLAHA